MSALPEVEDVYFVPPGAEVDGIRARDRTIRVTKFTNGFRAVTELPPEPEKYVPPEMTLSELSALAKEGKTVEARDVLPLVLRHRHYIHNMLYVVNHFGTSKFREGLAQWIYRVRRYLEEEIVL